MQKRIRNSSNFQLQCVFAISPFQNTRSRYISHPIHSLRSDTGLLRQLHTRKQMGKENIFKQPSCKPLLLRTLIGFETSLRPRIFHSCRKNWRTQITAISVFRTKVEVLMSLISRTKGNPKHFRLIRRIKAIDNIFCGGKSCYSTY
jgi:hypothetical protein